MRLKNILIIVLSFFCISCCYGQVYDCFTFFNETELLTVRLEELFEKVDYFVLVEATETFCGEPKPLYFQENIKLFEKYKSKIIHVVVNDFPPSSGDLAKDRWVREKFQRNAILRGLGQCKKNDIILISDLDEIPCKDSIDEIKSKYQKGGFNNRDVFMLRMKLFLFYLNRMSRYKWDGGSKAALYSKVKKLSPWEIKILHLNNKNLSKIENGGWHFHSMGGFEKVLEKLRAIYLYDKDSFIDPSLIKQLNPDIASLDQPISEEKWPDPIEIAQDPELYKKWTEVVFGVETVPIDHSFPEYIKHHKDYYSSIKWFY
jgi:beta-1,4-mannosyl-glycoprotein beta-1,4-N-acetylglucosaminyltransferase